MTKALTYVELDVDYCSLTYGVPPCRAHLGFADDNVGPYVAKLDGAYVLRGGNLSGVVDGKAGSLSMWVNIGNANGTQGTIFDTSNARFQLTRNSSNVFGLAARNSAGTVIMAVVSGVEHTSTTGWVNLLASWDLAAASIQMYVSDVQTAGIITNTNDTIDYTDTNFAIGAAVAGTTKFNGRLAEIWISTTTRIDFSVVANRRKFVTADLRPVFLGDAGELPTGTPPAVFLSGPMTGWHVNKGSGGGFTLNGELAEFIMGKAKCFNTIPTCQDRENFANVPVTLRFAKDSGYLPKDIPVVAASVDDYQLTPATISLGEGLGERASLAVTFGDHRHNDTGVGFDKYHAERGYDAYARGTFWGKFRARQTFLRGRPIRLINGTLGQALADMETRHFLIESFDGPTPDGKYQIVAKDPLKLLDGDRALAPLPSNGFLVAAITNVSAAFTLSPSGIGNAEYPAAFVANLGGSEIATVTRAGDVCTFVLRGLLGTTAAAHDAQDRVQVCLQYLATSPADILYNLFTVYGGVPTGYVTLSQWQSEVTTYLGNVYTATIPEPTPVKDLAEEIIQQAALAIWWNDRIQKIGLQVLRGVLADVDRFTESNTMQGTLSVREQPEKRVSQVLVLYGQINPLLPLDEKSNYRSQVLTVDLQAETDYGSAAIREFKSRWIAALGRAVAERLSDVVLSRYRDPPRVFALELFRGSVDEPQPAGGYRVESWLLQDDTGAPTDAPIQLTRIGPRPEKWAVEGEEILFTSAATDITDKTLSIDSNQFDVNVRSAHDSIYPPPLAGDTVTVNVAAGVIVGSTIPGAPALHIGSWPAGVTIILNVLGRIQGRAGNGGVIPSGSGNAGSPALYTRYAITLNSGSGQIWGGGGGGGARPAGGGGGGGGAGQQPGAGGGGFPAGSAGTTEAGGAGGNDGFGTGGTGGGPGLAGNAASGAGGPNGPGGPAGAAIDGISFVTGASGDIRGPQIN